MSTITIICCGKSGVGKSSIGNHLLTGNANSDLFKSGDDADQYGITKTIQSEIRTITIPDGQQISVQYLDIPGTGDPTLDTQRFIYEIRNKHQQTKLNIALLLVNAQDNRKTLQEAFSCSFYKSFFENNGLTSNQVVWLIITRSQETQVSDTWIEKKLKSLASDGITIDPSHVIKYRLGQTCDLNPLLYTIGQASQGIGYNFSVDLDNSAKEYKEMMDNITNTNQELRIELKSVQDKVNELQTQQQQLEGTCQTLQNNNNQLQDQREKERKEQEYQIIQAQLRPPQIIYRDDSFCSIF